MHCLAVRGVRDSEAAPAGLGQHARRRPMLRECAGERPPRRAGEGALPVNGALVPRALVAVPAGPGERAVLMHVVAPRARVAAPAGPGVRAVPMLLVIVPRARVGVAAGPGVRAMLMPLAVEPRARVGVVIGACDGVMHGVIGIKFLDISSSMEGTLT